MARYFFDTSALVKHYHAEAGTPVVDGIFAEAGAELLISRLAIVEVASALSLKVRTGEITSAQLGTAHKGFHTDISLRRLAVVRILVRHFSDAERLLLFYGTSQRLRTLDALQLAVAHDLWRNARIDRFLVADAVLVNVAAAMGLPATNVVAPVMP
jgi:uncharacterized protein